MSWNTEALKEADLNRAEENLGDLKRLLALKENWASLFPGVGAEKSPKHPPELPPFSLYLVGVLLLHRAYKYLVQNLPGVNQEPEWMVAVSGLRLGTILTLEHCFPLKLTHQSRASASADTKALTELLVGLSDLGFALHAIFHSHRFKGPPRPSRIDTELQDHLEQAGYPCIQAIFSEDGFVRFFANNRPFEIFIYGKGVEKHGRFLYRLSQQGSLSDTPTLF